MTVFPELERWEFLLKLKNVVRKVPEKKVVQHELDKIKEALSHKEDMIEI